MIAAFEQWFLRFERTLSDDVARLVAVARRLLRRRY